MAQGCSFRELNSDTLKKERNLLFRLSNSMVYARNKSGRSNRTGNNLRIPAGYTYLAQFIAHDLSSSQPLRKIGVGRQAARTIPSTGNPTASRLDLSTLYGDGPDISASLYEKDAASNYSWRLRLSPMKKFSRGNGRTSALGGSKNHLDFMRLCPAAGETVSQAIIADPRNDGHLLINQITVLFGRFHNHVADRVAMVDFGNAGNRSRRDVAAGIFSKSRGIVLAVFHNLIINDFLHRFVDSRSRADLSQLAELTRSPALGLGENVDLRFSSTVPLAFSSAAFRVGHAMARSHYSLSNHRTDHQPAPHNKYLEHSGLNELIDLTNRGRHRTPIMDDWAVEWDRFFFCTNPKNPVFETPDGRKLNYSNPIEPTCPSALGNNVDLFKTSNDNRGGVIYRDLVRGLSDGFSNADHFIEQYLPNIAEKETISVLSKTRLMNRYFLFSKSKRQKDTLTQQDIQALARRTPLFLYVLLEATLKHRGQHLGAVGSSIVGSAIANALVSASPDARRGYQEWQNYFKGKFPTSMPELLRKL